MIIFALNAPYMVNVTEVVNSNPAIIPASLQPVSSPTGAGGGGEFANPMNDECSSYVPINVYAALPARVEFVFNSSSLKA